MAIQTHGFLHTLLGISFGTMRNRTSNTSPYIGAHSLGNAPFRNTGVVKVPFFDFFWKLDFRAGHSMIFNAPAAEKPVANSRKSGSNDISLDTTLVHNDPSYSQFPLVHNLTCLVLFLGNTSVCIPSSVHLYPKSRSDSHRKQPFAPTHTNTKVRVAGVFSLLCSVLISETKL